MPVHRKEECIFALLVQTNEGKLVVSVDATGRVRFGEGVDINNVWIKIAETYCPIIKEILRETE